MQHSLPLEPSYSLCLPQCKTASCILLAMPAFNAGHCCCSLLFSCSLVPPGLSNFTERLKGEDFIDNKASVPCNVRDLGISETRRRLSHDRSRGLRAASSSPSYNGRATVRHCQRARVLSDSYWQMPWASFHVQVEFLQPPYYNGPAKLRIEDYDDLDDANADVRRRGPPFHLSLHREQRNCADGCSAKANVQQ